MGSTYGKAQTKEPMDSQCLYEKVDLITWIFEMEQFFDLPQVPTLQKVTIASLYLELDHFVWYQWLYDHKKDSI